MGSGIALGLIGSLLTTRLLRQEIFHVSPFDPISFAAVSMLLLATGLQACFWPARRAAKVDRLRRCTTNKAQEALAGRSIRLANNVSQVDLARPEDPARYLVISEVSPES